MKKEHFNDLLLPVIFVLCVMPFVVYLAEYDFGFSKYLWHSDNSTMQDLYNYYRSIFFFVILFFMVVILAFRLSLYRENTKSVKIFIPLAVYSFFAILSVIFSVNKEASLRGNYVEFEGIFVLVGYVLTAFYTYQIMEREHDYHSIVHAVMVMFIPMSMIGWFQVFKHDLLNYEWMQKIVMPDELFDTYGGAVEDVFTGNNVFLTLNNPNFAAIFLLMFACVFMVLFLGAKDKKEKIVMAVFLLNALVLCWFTYTRAALVALAVVAVVFAVCQSKKQSRKTLLYLLLAGVVLLVILFAADAISGGKYMERLLDEKKNDSLESVLTSKDGVEIVYDGTKYTLTIDEAEVKLWGPDESRVELEQTADGDYKLPFGENDRVNVIEWDGMPQILAKINDDVLQFVKVGGIYYYYTDWGKMDSMVEIPHADFHGMEYLGSSRLYIWSRIVPILKKYILVGSGPDTFAEVYPQNDYVGKMIYAQSTGSIMERAHNDFLMRWVQTGLLSLLSLLVFYLLFLRKCFGYYRNKQLTTMQDKLGFACFLGCVGYLVCCFFSDSTLYTTPVFYVFAGIALSAVNTENQM